MLSRVNTKFKNTHVVILAGGLGTRLKSVIVDRPKVLAPIGGRTVLDYIIDDLLRCGFYKITLSVGYMKEKIHDHIEKKAFPKSAVINFSEEENPLGTGGAIKRAMEGLSGELALILNGDTFFPIDYKRFIAQHKEHDAEISMCLRRVDDVRSSGVVFIDKKDRILSFKEKPDENNSGIINGGAYIFNKNIFDKFDLPEVFSVEKDFFEKYIDRIKAYGFVFPDYFIDIGTPESYRRAQNDFKV